MDSKTFSSRRVCIVYSVIMSICIIYYSHIRVAVYLADITSRRVFNFPELLHINSTVRLEYPLCNRPLYRTIYSSYCAVGIYDSIVLVEYI